MARNFLDKFTPERIAAEWGRCLAVSREALLSVDVNNIHATKANGWAYGADQSHNAMARYKRHRMGAKGPYDWPETMFNQDVVSYEPMLKSDG